MSKYQKLQADFTSGELSPKVRRPNIKEYEQGLDLVERFIVTPQGGAVKCPGMRFIHDFQVSTSTFTGARSVPFIFSKDESYNVIFNENPSRAGGNDFIKVFDASGTEITVDQTQFVYPAGTYDPKNWKFSQSGDILVLSYSDPNGISSALFSQDQAPAFLIRTDATDLGASDSAFTIVSISHPDFSSNVPSAGKFTPAVMRPYLSPNVDADKKLFVSTTAIGTGKTLQAGDASSNFIPFFTAAHTFEDDGTFPTQIGSFFKVSKAGTTGIFWGKTWWSDLLSTSAEIFVGTDILTFIGHALETGDLITLGATGNPGTDPTITGFPLTNGVYGNFYLRKLSANDVTFHPTEADARANTNLIDFATAGTAGIRWIHKQVHKMTGVVEVAFEASLTSVANATDDWQESSWSTFQGFPRASVFFEQRLYLGGARRKPDTFWGSQVGNIYNFMQTRLDQDSSSVTAGASTLSGLPFILSGAITETDPFSVEIASKKANIIQWMEAQSTLLVGTLGAEYSVTGGTAIISNSSIFIKKQTDHGSSNVQAISAGNSVLFVSSDGRRLRDFKFNDKNGSYISLDLSVVADHMVFKGFAGTSASAYKGIKIKEVHYQPSRACIWMLTDRSALIASTFSLETNTLAWHYHPTRAGDTIKSISVIPSTDSTFEEVWLVVERNIDGADEVYLEKMADDFEHTTLANTSTEEADQPFYSDSSIRIDLGSPGTAVAGLDHLEGETVQILADGLIQTDKTVSSGAITLDTAATIVIVGFKYTSKLRTLDIEAGGDFGTSKGTIKKIDRVILDLYRSFKGSVKNPQTAEEEDVEYDGTEVETGIKRIHYSGSPDEVAQIEIIHDEPVPFHVLSLTMRGVTYD